MVTEDDAKLHYVTKGRAEGRFYKRLRVLLRYTACTGLINQQYSHIAAFALSAVRQISFGPVLLHLWPLCTCTTASPAHCWPAQQAQACAVEHCRL